LPVFRLLMGDFEFFLPCRGETLHRWGWNVVWRNRPSYSVFNLGVHFPPNFHDETVGRMQIRFRGARMVQTTFTVPSLEGVRLRTLPGGGSLMFFLSRFWMTKFVNATSPSARWNMETILAPLERGRFVVVHPHSTLSLQRWAEQPHNDKFEKRQNCFFLLLRGDRIHWIGLNLAGTAGKFTP